MKLSDFKKAYDTLFKSPEDFKDQSKIERVSKLLSDRYLKRTFKPFNYQIPAIFAISNCGNIILSDKPGLGKTAETIAAFSDIYTKEKGKYIVVCPASIIGQWKDSVIRFSNFIPLIVNSQNLHKLEKIDKDGIDIVIMSYNTAVKLYQTGYYYPFNTIVFDEAESLKAPNTDFYKYLSNAALKIKRKILLTGTPSTGKLEDSFCYLSILTNGQYSYFGLLNKYCEQTKKKIPIFDKYTGARRNLELKIITSYKNIEEFKELFNSYVFGRSIEETGAEMPKQNKHLVLLDKVDFQQKFEDLTIKGVFINTDKTQRKLNNLQKISYLARGFHSMKMLYPEASVSNPKIDKIFELIEENKGKQVAIFCNYKQILQEIYPVLKERGGCTIISGDVSRTKRINDLEDFRSGKTQYIIFTLAGYAGIDLNNCDTLIVADFVYSKSKFDQILGRITRCSSNFKEVDVYLLAYKDSIDTAILELLGSRQQMKDFIDTLSEERVSEILLNNLKKKGHIDLSFNVNSL